MEEPLSVEVFTRTALHFSGVSPDRYDPYVKELESLKQKTRAQAAEIDDAYAKGRFLLHFLHDEVYVRYREPQTAVDVLLDTGMYNCVSSAVLYAVFAKDLGIPVRGVVTSDHAFCAVQIGERWVDVETTNRYGFEPGTKEEFRDAFGNTGFSYVPPGEYGKRTIVGEKDLLALILQNRIAMLQRSLSFEESVGLAADRYAAVETQAARKEMMSEFANYGAKLNEQHRYEQAMEFIESVVGVYGPDATMYDITGVISHNWILEYLATGEIRKAREVFDHLRLQDSLSPADVNALESMIADSETNAAVRELSFQDAYTVLARTRSLLPSGQYENYAVYLYTREAERISNSQGALFALRFLESAPPEISGNTQLRKAREVYAYNHAAEVHNLFASHFNAGEYPEAGEVLSAGLADLPGNQLLERDLRLLQQVSAPSSDR